MPWPAGTTWRDDGVVLPSGETMAVGDEVAVGGGWHSFDSLDRWLDSPAATDALAACLADTPSGDGVFVVQCGPQG